MTSGSRRTWLGPTTSTNSASSPAGTPAAGLIAGAPDRRRRRWSSASARPTIARTASARPVARPVGRPGRRRRRRLADRFRAPRRRVAPRSAVGVRRGPAGHTADGNGSARGEDSGGDRPGGAGCRRRTRRSDHRSGGHPRAPWPRWWWARPKWWTTYWRPSSATATSSSRTCRGWARPCWPAAWPPPSGVSSVGCSSRLTSCPATSPGRASSTSGPPTSPSAPAPSSPRCCWPTRSTGPPRAPSRPSSRPWRSTRSPPTAAPGRCPIRSSSWRPRTRSSSRAPSPCPRPSSTVS